VESVRASLDYFRQEEILVLRWNSNPRTAQPVASPYIDYDNEENTRK